MEGKSQTLLDATALVSLNPPLEFSYKELITQAQLVAQGLLTLDSSHRFVIIFFERSPAFVLSMLGTLMAGKVGVPMDATHTSERLTGMKESLGEAHPVVLTSQECRATAEKLFGGSIIFVGDLSQPTVDSFVTSDWNLPRIAPTNLAFVYFTSGSTGKPKAVPERHESVVNYILGGYDILTLLPNCRFLQAMNIGIDSSLSELFTTYYTGVTVVLQSDDLIDSLGKVDACMLTPSMLQAVVDPLEYPGLRVVVTVVEPLPFPLTEKWYQAQGRQLQLSNAYGPTETVVTSHFEHLTITPDNSLVTIGRTIPNVQYYILDDTHRLVPIGVIGEICIGGMGVCNSYLNDEQCSRDVFVPNTLGSGMLYRTGDLGRWLANGRVYCMGSKDNQVKLHGFRVELGEIEYAIRNSSTTDNMENACVVYDHNKGSLVGYVAPSDVDSELVLSALWERLPSYMVPDHIIPVDKFPLTSNGKVDRKALLANHSPENGRFTTVSPLSTMTPMQRQLIHTLCAMLHVNPDEVHPHRDTFFTL
ncbi:putative NRPS-like protein biosynthetic cluster [Dispira simplex]|nr:putative NRPS-like protein biosynthetic cluster [Dispira simplex]